MDITLTAISWMCWDEGENRLRKDMGDEAGRGGGVRC